jgi:hypothetical protein
MFETAHNLRNDLSSSLNTAFDGWVPPAEREVTKSAYRETFKGMLEAVLTNEDPGDEEAIRSEGDLSAIWSFDI